MARNTLKCNHLKPLRFKGLRRHSNADNSSPFSSGTRARRHHLTPKLELYLK